MYACLLEAFADHDEYFLTDHALLIYEAYANIVECVMCVFQLLTRQWQNFARTNRHTECISVGELCSSAG